MKIPRKALWALTIIACISFAVMVGEAQAITKDEAKTKAVEGADAIGTVNTTEPAVEEQREGRPAYKITTRGTFKDTTAHVPRGQSAPTGTILEQAYDAETGWRVWVHLGGEPTATIARHRAHKATWGGKCSPGEGHHCYAMAEWTMVNSTEKIRGAEADINTWAMEVFDYNWGGPFVDNEMWEGFPGTHSPVNGKEYWLELGQWAGNGRGCCSLFWFTAWNRAGGYEANEPPWAMPFNNFARYRADSQLNGWWCFTIEGAGASCYQGFPHYAKTVEVGIEAATNVKPSNGMQDQTNVVWTDGSTHPWNTGKWYRDPGFCIQGFSRENPPRYYYGNAQMGTC